MFSCIYRQCNETFFNVEELKNHCLENHRKANLKWYHCPVEQCESKYKSRSGVYRHLKTNHADMEEVEGDASDVEVGEVERHHSDQEEVVERTNSHRGISRNNTAVEVEEVEEHNSNREEEIERNHSRRDISRNNSAVESEANETMNTARNVTPNVSRRQSVRTPAQEAVVAADDEHHQDSPPRVNRNLKLSDFDIGMPLGEGQFGKVNLAREKEHKIFVALKMFYKARLQKEKMEKHIVREIDIQCHLRHPNILRMYNYFFDKKHIFLILEYALHGELFGILKKMKRFCEKRTAWYIFQVADALNYCHSKNVIHRDIKPENILVSADGSLKLADFGGSIHSTKKRASHVGTEEYCSPEMVTGKRYDYRIDNWAVGVLCYELLSGRSPFWSKIVGETRRLIGKVKYDFKNKPFTNDSKDLISKLLVRDPTKRLSLDAVMNHYWIQEQLELARHESFAVDYLF